MKRTANTLIGQVPKTTIDRRAGIGFSILFKETAGFATFPRTVQNIEGIINPERWIQPDTVKNVAFIEDWPLHAFIGTR